MRRDTPLPLRQLPPAGHQPLLVCRLPFTDHARFDFDKFAAHVGAAQRIMDDIIDLEAEKIDAIIEKIASDPETAEVKQTELALWQKIRRKTLIGRRTGVGTTGEGDMLAALGLRYGTPEATDFSELVHRSLALAAYRASVELYSPARSIRDLRHRTREKQPLHNAPERGRSAALRRHGQARTAQHSMPDHSAHRHHKPHDADHIGHRAGVHARLQSAAAR